MRAANEATSLSSLQGSEEALLHDRAASLGRVFCLIGAAVGAMGLLGWITSEYAKAAKAFLPLIPVEQFPHLNGISQEVIAGRHDGLHQLEFGIERQAYIAYQITI